MSAGEHQSETPVRHVGRVHGRGRLFDRQQQPVGGRLPGASPPRHVDHPPARCSQKPGLGCLWDTAYWPAGECPCKRVGERILCSGDIAGSRSEVGYQLAVALPRRAFGCAIRG